MLQRLPNKPGVYLIKDKSGKIIYIGKAISIAKRVPSHFRTDSKIAPYISDVDFIVTSNELEALILEAVLIKKHRPKYNVLLRDDKQYPYLKLTINEEWPRLLTVRKVLDDGAKYFGPYRGQTVRDIIKIIKRLFQIRWCKNYKKRQQPCFYYHLGKCFAPCAKDVSKEEYYKSCRDIEYFLEGKYELAIDKLKKEMAAASASKEYESAARIRDKIKLFERIFEEQKIVTPEKKNIDVFTASVFGNYALILVLQIRGGKLTGKESFFIKNIKNKDEDILVSSLIQYYSSATYIPDEIVAEVNSQSRKLVEGALIKIKKAKVILEGPKKGLKKGLFKMALENSKLILDEKLKTEGEIYGTLVDLEKITDMKKPPYRIEAFDISTTMGTETVGSMVAFENGSPLRSDYRKFKIKWIKGMNDVAGISEIVRRRYHGALANELPLPDLILIDGGKPQLNAARRFAPKSPAIAALAKKLEEVYLPGWKNPIRLNKNVPAMRLLRRIRDEAHRFAITYHRKRRTNRMLSS